MYDFKLAPITLAAITKIGTIAPLSLLPAIGTVSILAAGGNDPAIAHNVEVANDVAVTMHIEPNHNPKAGEPTLAWFALTRKGGQLIPATACDCQLRVYSKPHKEGTAPVLQYSLTGINAEQYQNIPGRTVTFPRAGQYLLEIAGKPKGDPPFTPFAIRYTVTVTGGTPTTSPTPATNLSPAATAPQPNTSTSSPTNQLPTFVLGLGLLTGLGILAGWLMRQRKKDE